MKKASFLKPLFGSALLAATPLLTPQTFAANLLDEQFSNGDRVTQKLPSSAHWFLDGSSGAYSSRISGREWNLLAPTAPSQLSAVAYLSSTSPLPLQPGSSLVFSFTIRPSSPLVSFGFGFYNSAGSRLTADTTGGSTTCSAYQGYSAQASSVGLTLAKRESVAPGLASPIALRPLGHSLSPLLPGLSYPAKLTLTRGEGSQVTITAEVAGCQTSAVEENGLSSFDTIAVLLDGQMGVVSLESLSVNTSDGNSSDSSKSALAQNSSPSNQPAVGSSSGSGDSSSASVASSSTASESAHTLSTMATGSTWYLQFSQTSTAEDWNTLAEWFSGTSGGTHPAAIAATDTFDSNNFLLHTPVLTTGTTTFGGGTLIMGASSTLSILGSNTTTTVVPYLISNGGVIKNTGGTTQYLTIPLFSHPAGTLTFQTGASTRSIWLTSGTLTGAGNLTFGGGGGYKISLTDAYNYSGTFTASTGTMTFQNPVVLSAPMVIADTSRINLTQAISCASLTLTGASIVPATGDKPGSYTYPPGTYSYATLNAAYPNIFISGSAPGSITVQSGTTYYLTVNQAIGRDWSNLYASDWNSLANGTGTAAPAVDPVDDYAVNGKLLRSPGPSGTFPGRTLILDSGTIGLKDIPPNVVTVPSMVATKGTIQFFNSSGTTAIRINYLTKNSGTTTIGANTNQAVDFGVDYLSGTGDFRFASAGSCVLNITDASQFTGTYTQASGTLILSPITSGPVFAVGSPFAIKGGLVIATGASVVLNRDTYVGSLTVNGLVQPNGTYAASTLGFSGTANMVVYTPDLTGPPQMFGVNLPGGTFAAGGALLPTNTSTWDYYQGKGLTLIRVAFHWNDVQTALSGTLNTAVMNKMDTILSLANARGMKVIFDMHNYGQYTVSGTGQNIGTTLVPYSAYQDVWSRLSAHFAANPNKAAIYGYDIMNEPVKLGSDWPNAAKYAIAGIRANDMSTYIIAEGKSYAGAQSWTSQNGDLGFVDPACRLIYSAHSYWGKNHNDNYLAYDGTGGENGYPNMGVDQLRLFVTWLQKRHFHGFVGEYGVPTNVATPDTRWHTVLDNSLNYLRTNGVSGTYWSGGAGWGTYSLLCDTGTPPVDAPAMSIVQLYHQ